MAGSHKRLNGNFAAQDRCNRITPYVSGMIGTKSAGQITSYLFKIFYDTRILFRVFGELFRRQIKVARHLEMSGPIAFQV